jgi:hypothetical protein
MRFREKAYSASGFAYFITGFNSIWKHCCRHSSLSGPRVDGAGRLTGVINIGVITWLFLPAEEHQAPPAGSTRLLVLAHLAVNQTTGRSIFARRCILGQEVADLLAHELKRCTHAELLGTLASCEHAMTWPIQ